MTLQLNDPERMAEFQRRLAAAGLTPAPAVAERAPGTGAGADRRALEPSEAGLWFLDRLHPGSPEYIVAAAVAIRGDLDPGRLAAVFAGLVARHPTLRTRFADNDGTAYAETMPQAHPRLRSSRPHRTWTPGCPPRRRNRSICVPPRWPGCGWPVTAPVPSRC